MRNNPQGPSIMSPARLALFSLLTCVALIGAGNWSTVPVSANHPVFVEGDTDFDGDNLVGLAEDTDNGTDNVFGTLTAALGSANNGANQNGRVLIVTSGRFRESITITGANGNVSVEAAPGVEADIDAVVAGDRSSQFPGTTNATAQALPGIIVDAPANRVIVLRNLMTRNWTDGIRVLNNSRVTIDNVRAEYNTNTGIAISGNARVSISNSQINGTGFRAGATGNFPSEANVPAFGHGISFSGASRGSIIATSVTSSFGVGIVSTTGNPSGVVLQSVNSFDNAVNFDGVRIPN
jgi:hypothetical protein